MPSLSSLPLSDPGEPDARSGPRLLLWLEVRQWRGQVAAAAWGTLHMAAVASFPAAVGSAVQAVVDRSGTRLALAGAVIMLLGAADRAGRHHAAPHRGDQLDLRRRPRPAAADPQDRRAGRGAHPAGGGRRGGGRLHRRRGEDRLVRGGARALHLGAAGHHRRGGRPGGLPARARRGGGRRPCPCSPWPCCRCCPRRPGAPTSSARRRARRPSWRPTRSPGCGCCAASAARSSSSTATGSVSQEVRTAAVHSARMWALISAVQVALPGLLLVGVAWYGARLALDGRISVGELVTVYGSVAFLMFPLRNFGEIAMAWSFSRPSAKRAARVLALRRTDAAAAPRTDSGPHARQADTGRAPGPDPVRPRPPPPGSCTTRRPGCGCRPACSPPWCAATRTRRGGWPTGWAGTAPRRPRGVPSALLGGRPLDDVPVAAARAAVLVQDKDPVLLSGTLAELLDVPVLRPGHRAGRAGRGAVRGRARRAGAVAWPEPTPRPATRCGHGSSSAAGRCPAASGSGSRWPVRWSPTPAVLVLDEPTSAVDAHTEARIARGLQRDPGGADDRGVHLQPAGARPGRPGGVRGRRHARRPPAATTNCCAPTRATGRW